MSHDLTASSAHQERHVGNYQLLRTLGQGSYGKVWLALHNLTGTAVAVKAIRNRQGHSVLQRHRSQEAECMAVLHHPHIVQLFEVIVTRDAKYLIMEHVSGGDLEDYLQMHGMLSEDEARGIFRQLVAAVQYMHQKGVIHRDLKPSNVLLEADKNVKVADFGLSTFFNKKKLSTFCGSPFYTAPEVFRAEEYEGPPVDVWSLGVLLYTMVTGRVPFEKEDLKELKKSVLSGKYTMPSYLSLQLQLLLTQLLTVNPKERSNLGYVTASLWLDRDDGGQSEETPPSEELDPWVTQEMVDMGFQQDQIQRALKNKTYDYVMGTYLLLDMKKPKVHTVPVKPFAAPDDTNEVPTREVQPECSRPQHTEQQHKVHKPGRKAVEFTDAAARPTSRTDTPGPRPESRTATPGPSGKSRTPTTGPSLKSNRASPAPTSKWSKVSPRHSPKSRAAILTPTPKSRIPSPRPRPKMKAAILLPIQESDWRVASPQLTPELESVSSISSLLSALELGTTTPQLTQEPQSRTTTPAPIAELETCTSLSSELVLGATTPHFTQGSESTATTPAPISELETCTSLSSELVLWVTTPHFTQESESTATTPPPISELESRSAIPPVIPESEGMVVTSPPGPETKATPSPVRQCEPGVSRSSHGSSSSGSQKGRRGLARRCWDRFKQLCLRPCRKGLGRHNKIMPL